MGVKVITELSFKENKYKKRWVFKNSSFYLIYRF
jgi:hypothetical protein